MTEIPDDIMKAAQGSIDRMPDLGSPMEPGEFWARVEYEVVSAILAERQRCAGAAKALLDEQLWNQPPGFVRGVGYAAQMIYDDIASAPSPKPEPVSEGGEDE